MRIKSWRIHRYISPANIDHFVTFYAFDWWFHFFWVCNSIFLSPDPKKRLKSGQIFGLGQREVFVFSVPIEMPNLWVRNVFLWLPDPMQVLCTKNRQTIKICRFFPTIYFPIYFPPQNQNILPHSHKKCLLQFSQAFCSPPDTLRFRPIRQEAGTGCDGNIHVLYKTKSSLSPWAFRWNSPKVPDLPEKSFVPAFPACDR